MTSDNASERRIRSVLYVTAIDLSLPLGPSVNEREFVASLHGEFGDKFRLLIPKPKNELPEAGRYRVTYLPTPNPRNPFSYLGFQNALYREAAQMIEDEPVDLVVTRPDLLPIGVCKLARNLKVPIAIKHLTGYPAAFMEDHRGIKRFMGSLIAPYRTKMLQFLAHHAITSDACTEGHIAGIRTNLGVSGEKVILVENATNTDRFFPADRAAARKSVGLEKFDPIVGYCGGVPWERGGRQLIEVAKRLRECYPNVGIAIVGGGPRIQELRDLAQSLGVADFVHLPGFVPYDRVADYINAFDVGVAFDRADRHDTVGNSNQKVRQYIACGLPVVVTPGGSEFVERDELGSVIDATDLDAVVGALTRWLDLKPEERKAHEVKAAAYAREHLSVQSTIRQRVAAWERQLAKKAS